MTRATLHISAVLAYSRIEGIEWRAENLSGRCRNVPIRFSQRTTNLAVNNREAAADIIFAELTISIQRGTSESRCRSSMSTPYLHMHTASARIITQGLFSVCARSISGGDATHTY